MKEKREKFKEMLKNPRKKALFQLKCWLIAFLVFYGIVLITPHPTPKYVSSNSNINFETDTIENLKNMSSFEYKYTISYQGKEEEMIGTFFQKNDYFTYLGEEYYKTVDGIYLVNEKEKSLLPVSNPMVLLLFDDLKRENLENYMKDGEVIEEKEYKDGKKVTSFRYQVGEEKYLSMVVTEQDHFIVDISIDLKEYLETKQLFYDIFEVHLEYNEINSLVSYSKNYADYQVVLEGE